MTEERDAPSGADRPDEAETAHLERTLENVLTERTSTPAIVVELLESLYDQAAAHLRLEESLVIESAAATDPDVAQRCHQLCDVHEALKSDWDRILAITQQGLCTPDWWTTLEREFQSLRSRLPWRRERPLR